MPVTGDPNQLRMLSAKLAKLVGTPKRAAQIAASQLEPIVLAQYDSGTGPYGEVWATPKSGGTPNVASGKMRGATTVKPAGAKVRIRINVPYAQFTGVKRPVLPMAGVMPPAWDPIIKSASEQAIAAIMGGR